MSAISLIVASRVGHRLTAQPGLQLFAFGAPTFAGYGKLDPDISFKKLKAMADGAALASRRLWSRH